MLTIITVDIWNPFKTLDISSTWRDIKYYKFYFVDIFSCSQQTGEVSDGEEECDLPNNDDEMTDISSEGEEINSDDSDFEADANPIKQMKKTPDLKVKCKVPFGTKTMVIMFSKLRIVIGN